MKLTRRVVLSRHYSGRMAPVAEPYAPEAHVYEQRQASRDGTGKVYMGREISQVMGHAAIDWLERPEREAEEATSRVMQGAGAGNQTGCGGGRCWFRLRLLFLSSRKIWCH